MTTTTSLKNIVAVITTILESSLSEKTAKKAVAAINTADATAMLNEAMAVAFPKARERGKGKPRDAAAPKKRRSAYIIFGSHERPSIKETFPEMKSTEIMSEIGRRWKTLSADEKEPFNALAATDKIRADTEEASYTPSTEYTARLEAFNSDSDSGKKSNRKKSNRKKKAKDSPKNAIGVYIWFCKAQRAQIVLNNPLMKSSEIMSEMGRVWRDEVKGTPAADVYIAQAAADKIRAAADKEAYEAKKAGDNSASDNSASDCDSILVKSTKVKRTKKASPALMIFRAKKCAKFAAANPTLSAKDVKVAVDADWRENYEGTDKAAKYEKKAASKKAASKKAAKSSCSEVSSSGNE